MTSTATDTMARASLDAPMGRIVGSLGRSVGQAQLALWASSLATLSALSGERPETRLRFAGQTRSLLELGFRPAFHAIRETTVDMRLTYTMTRAGRASETTETERPYGRGAQVARISPLTIASSNRYQLHHTGASRLRTRLTATPAPAALADHIRASFGSPAGDAAAGGGG